MPRSGKPSVRGSPASAGTKHRFHPKSHADLQNPPVTASRAATRPGPPHLPVASSRALMPTDCFRLAGDLLFARVARLTTATGLPRTILTPSRTELCRSITKARRRRYSAPISDRKSQDCATPGWSRNIPSSARPGAGRDGPAFVLLTKPGRAPGRHLRGAGRLRAKSEVSGSSADFADDRALRSPQGHCKLRAPRTTT